MEGGEKRDGLIKNYSVLHDRESELHDRLQKPWEDLTRVRFVL